MWRAALPAEKRRRGCASSRRRSRGFTLLEVLVAATIASLGFLVLFRSAPEALFSVRAAGRTEAAVALARSCLSVAALDPQRVAGVTEGNQDGFHWRTRVVRAATTSPGTGVVERFLHGRDASATLYDLDATVSWGARAHPRRVRLTTQRLAFLPPPPAEP